MTKKYELIITGQNNHYSACLPELGIGGSGPSETEALDSLVVSYSTLEPDTQPPIEPNNQYQPDWSKAPEWAMYHAVDRDKDSWWYQVKPELGEKEWIEPSYSGKVHTSKFDLKDGDWTKSLTKRPIVQQ